MIAQPDAVTVFAIAYKPSANVRRNLLMSCTTIVTGGFKREFYVSVCEEKLFEPVLNFFISVAGYNVVLRRNMIFTTLVFFSKICKQY